MNFYSVVLPKWILLNDGLDIPNIPGILDIPNIPCMVCRANYLQYVRIRGVVCRVLLAIFIQDLSSTCGHHQQTAVLEAISLQVVLYASLLSL